MFLLVVVTALLIGSFLNVCIYRLPRGESILWPPSRCPHCQERLQPAELLPLFSFCWQRGRCRHCRQPISRRYPLIELLTAGLYGLFYLRWGCTLELVYHAGLVSLLLVISCIDIETMLIPSSLVWFGVIVSCAYNLWTQQPWWDWSLAAISGYGLFYLIYVLSRGGMGGGDVRLAGMLGMVLGLRLLACALFVAFVSGAGIALLLLASGKAGRKTALPFAPFLAAGYLLASLWGDGLLDWYYGWFS